MEEVLCGILITVFCLQILFCVVSLIGSLGFFAGSSFPKPKPKHGIFTTTRLALMRFLFLPIFHKWWSTQISQRLFLLFLCLYGLQVGNVFLYLNSSSTSLQLQTNKSASSVISSDSNEAAYRPSKDTNSNVPPPGQQIPAGVQSSEIISPVILMVALTILHSQIVATHVSSKDKGEEKRSKSKERSSSADILKARKRRSARVPPCRRRTSIHGVATSATHSSGSSTSTTTTNIRKSIKLQAKHSKDNLLIASSTTSIKKVIFEDESKSLSSNSDKDEGIAEEITESLSVENDDNEEDCVFEADRGTNESLRNTDLVQAHMQTSIKKVRHSVAPNCNTHVAVQELLSVDNDEEGKSEDSKISDERSSDNQNEPCEKEATAARGSVKTLRSNLRKRIVSKQSEASTTSCGELSSNNNDSSTDEDIGEETMEDEELRSKSEWTAVTTNSEDDDYGDEINNSDEEELEEEATFEIQLNDHPFAWEFQQVISKLYCFDFVQELFLDGY